VCVGVAVWHVQDELQQYVEYMNGEWTNQFQTNVTILVAEHSGSPKFVTALERNVAIVKPEWIGSCWAEGKRLPFPTYSFAPAPIFSGCVIVTSGLTAELRERVRRETEERGGTYLGNLTTNCTHLITTVCCCVLLRKSPSPSHSHSIPLICAPRSRLPPRALSSEQQQQGAKFEKAITLPCHIVRLDWFHECVRDSSTFPSLVRSFARLVTLTREQCANARPTSTGPRGSLVTASCICTAATLRVPSSWPS